MVKQIKYRWLFFLLLLISVISAAGTLSAASTAKPAIVLAAFGTSTEAFDTYSHFEQKVKERFPGYEIRWAFTSHKVRHKVAKEKGQQLNDLPTTLKTLKAAGFTRVAIQSLHIVPGEEWDRKVVQESRKIPGLKVALGKPLLSSKQDQEQVLNALAQTFPKDLTATAVVLVAHGSPSPEGIDTYLAFSRLLRARYPHQNVFFPRHVAVRDGQMVFPVQPVLVEMERKVAVAGRKPRADGAVDQPFRPAAILDQIGNRNHLQMMSLREFLPTHPFLLTYSSSAITLCRRVHVNSGPA